MSSRKVVLPLAALAFGPMLLTAPRAASDGPGLAELEARCRASGLAGLELVELATQLVREQISQQSIWHLWERPETSLRKGRGWEGQYNIALARLLRRLGFDVQVVHAARVRGLGAMPWWQAGHTWVRVTIDERRHEVTAARVVGKGLVPLSEVRPINVWTLPTVSLALAPIVAYQSWKALVTGQDVPDWMLHEQGRA